MTPLTRADAIAAEADELPLEAPVAPLAGYRGPCMPELPEVETVARDLRPRLVGATIVGARIVVGADAAHARPERVRRSRRRATSWRPWAVARSCSSWSCRTVLALTIHLKMTGQLFVVPAERRRIRTSASCSSSRTAASSGSATSASSGGWACTDAIPPPASCRRSVGGAAVFAGIGPEPLEDDLHRCGSSGDGFGRRKGRLKPLLLDQSFLAGVGNIYADEALWRARLHPLRIGGDAAAARRAPAVRGDPERPGRGGRAARLVRSTTTRRPTATARCRSGCRSTSGPASRARAAVAADPADRRRGALDALLLVVPAAAGGGPAGARGDPSHAARAVLCGAGGRWTELAAEGALGLTPEETGARRRHRPGPSGRSVPRRPGGQRRERPASAGRGLMSILRLAGVTREVGTFVILDGIDAAIALGDRIGLVGPNGAGKTTLLRLAAGPRRARPREGQPQARADARAARPGGALRRGLHGGARPAQRRFGRARRTSSRWRPSSAALEHAGRVRRAALRRPPAPVRDARRLHARPARRAALSGLGFAPRRVGASRRPRCRAASRRGPRWPGS